MEEFSPGIKIMIERIREFPEDFEDALPGNLYADRLSWENLVGEVMRDNDTFTKEEQKAVRDALRGARRARFDGAVMELLAKKPEDTVEKWRDFNTQYAAALKGVITTGIEMSEGPKNMIINRTQMEVAKRIAEAKYDQELAKAKMKGDKF